MVVKINSKPIRVRKDDDIDWWKEVDWVYLSVATIGTLLGFYVIDLSAWNFLSVHPFPFTKFIGVILSWF